MAKSLYSQYLREREGADLIEFSWGFAVYKMAKDHVYLQDIYVVPEERQNGRGVELMNLVADEARKQGVKTMYGSVAPSTQFSDVMIKIMMGLGFKLHSSQNDLIYLKKDI